MMKPLPQLADLGRTSGSSRPGRYRYSARPSQVVPTEAAATDIVELIHAACRDGSRRAVRIATADAKGSLFFDAGHIVHAEFGEDYGLRAIAPMLRAGPFVVDSWKGAWPSHPSLHLSAELLLSMVGRESSTPGQSEAYQLDTRVIRKVAQRVTQPPPLPDPVSIADFGFDNTEEAAPLSERLAALAPSVSAHEASSMVRVSAGGALLAEHGPHSARLADAAAFIHGLANAISADLGGCVGPDAGRAAVHLRGRGRSLFVVRSEVGDIAAAFGRTTRLASLLRKVGLR